MANEKINKVNEEISASNSQAPNVEDDGSEVRVVLNTTTQSSYILNTIHNPFRTTISFLFRIQGDWLMQFDANGNEFWVNQITGVSAWEVKQNTFFHSCESPFLSAQTHKHTYIHINILYIITVHAYIFSPIQLYIHTYPHP